MYLIHPVILALPSCYSGISSFDILPPSRRNSPTHLTNKQTHPRSKQTNPYPNTSTPPQYEGRPGPPSPSLPITLALAPPLLQGPQSCPKHPHPHRLPRVPDRLCTAPGAENNSLLEYLFPRLPGRHASFWLPYRKTCVYDCTHEVMQAHSEEWI